MGEDATRDVWVCGPGAHVVLKAPAFASRGENKDAYDLFYVVRDFGPGVERIPDGGVPIQPKWPKLSRRLRGHATAGKSS